MNTEYVTDDMASHAAKNRTLKTLLQVICAEDEFSMLRETLRLYCEFLAEEEK